jgi:hypothetical protein
VQTKYQLPLAVYAAHFWAHAEIQDDGCWLWRGAKGSSGKWDYGTHGVHPEVGESRANRIAWVLANGQPIPPKLFVLHSCDNPACVSPFHLRVGTHVDNMRDVRDRGRHACHTGKGEGARAAKLTDVQVKDMFRRRGLGETYQSIGDFYGVTKTRVWQIVRNGEWTFTTEGDG